MYLSPVPHLPSRITNHESRPTGQHVPSPKGKNPSIDSEAALASLETQPCSRLVIAVAQSMAGGDPSDDLDQLLDSIPPPLPSPPLPPLLILLILLN